MRKDKSDFYLSVAQEEEQNIQHQGKPKEVRSGGISI